MNQEKARAVLNIGEDASAEAVRTAHEAKRSAMVSARNAGRDMKQRYAALRELQRIDQALAVLASGKGEPSPPLIVPGPEPDAPPKTSSPMAGLTGKLSAVQRPGTAWAVCGALILVGGLMLISMNRRVTKAEAARRVAEESARGVQPMPREQLSAGEDGGQAVAQLKQQLRRAEIAQRDADQRATAAGAAAARAERAQQEAERTVQTVRNQLASEQQARRQAEAAANRRDNPTAAATPAANLIPAATPRGAGGDEINARATPSTVTAANMAAQSVPDFVKAHFARFIRGEMAAMLEDYAEPADFDGETNLSRNDIERKRQVIFNRWPVRSGSINGPIIQMPQSHPRYGRIIGVQFSWSHHYENQTSTRARGQKPTSDGKALDTWGIATIDGQLKIVSEQSR